MSNSNQLTKVSSRQVEIGIPAEARQKLADILSVLLADQHYLYIKLRNYHWNVTGMFFGPLHELFQEQYEFLEKAIDDTAERIRFFGHFCPGSMQQFLQLGRLVETDHVDGDAKTMVTNLLHDHEALIQILRKDVDTADEELHDMGTADFLTGLMEKHEKMAWMLRAHLA